KSDKSLGSTISVRPVRAFSPTTCATGGTCKVGETGPGGGTVFYVHAGDPFTSPGSTCNTAGLNSISTCKYLEAAPAGWIVSTTPANQTNCALLGTTLVDPRCVWSGNTSTAIPGNAAQGQAIGTGHANTTAIIAQSDTAGKAATAARAYRGGSKTDWFLPSRLELNQLCRYAWNLTADSTAITCTDMTGTIRTGFSTGYYFSSSEWNADTVWYQGFILGGYQGLDKKMGSAYLGPFYVRPVRAF
ncbi:MAG: hypothetical protein WCL35_02810, partial [bacterium]